MAAFYRGGRGASAGRHAPGRPAPRLALLRRLSLLPAGPGLGLQHPGEVFEARGLASRPARETLALVVEEVLRFVERHHEAMRTIGVAPPF